MKLDRNTNTGEVGKYSLLLNRHLTEVLKEPGAAADEVKAALAVLEGHGLLDHGNDPDKPEKQFFVMRYGDALTHWGLWNYGGNALAEARTLRVRADLAKTEEAKVTFLERATSLEEFAKEIHAECLKIQRLKTPKKYPTE